MFSFSALLEPTRLTVWDMKASAFGRQIPPTFRKVARLHSCACLSTRLFNSAHFRTTLLAVLRGPPVVNSEDDFQKPATLDFQDDKGV